MKYLINSWPVAEGVGGESQSPGEDVGELAVLNQWNNNKRFVKEACSSCRESVESSNLTNGPAPLSRNSAATDFTLASLKLNHKRNQHAVPLISQLPNNKSEYSSTDKSRQKSN